MIRHYHNLEFISNPVSTSLINTQKYTKFQRTYTPLCLTISELVKRIINYFQYIFLTLLKSSKNLTNRKFFGIISLSVARGILLDTYRLPINFPYDITYKVNPVYSLYKPLNIGRATKFITYKLTINKID